MRKWIFIMSIFVVITAIALLVSGSDLLLIMLHEPSNLPSGTFITWLGLIALPIVFMSSSKLLWERKSNGKWYGTLLRFGVLVGACWGFISYALSGRWNFTFSGYSATYVGSAEAGELFWQVTYGITRFPIIVFLLFCTDSVFRWLMRDR